MTRPNKAVKETMGTPGSVALIQFIFANNYLDTSGDIP